MPQLDPAKAKVKTTLKLEVTLYGLAADFAGQRLYGGADDYAIHVIDLAAEKPQVVSRWTKHDNYVSTLVFLQRASKPLLVSGSYDRQLIWWDGDGQPLRTVEAHQGWVRDLRALPDGNRLVSVGDDMLVKLWETDTGKLVRSFAGHATRTPQGHVTALYVVAVSLDGKHLASADRHGEVRVWETETGKLAQRFEVPILYTYDERERKRSIGGIRSLAFSPDGAFLAVGGIGKVGNVDGLDGVAHIEIWDWRKPEVRAVGGAQGQKAMIGELRFTGDGHWLLGAGGGGDGALLAFWKTDNLAELPKEKKDPLPVTRYKADGHFHRLAWNAEAQAIVTAGYKKLDVWTV